MSDEKFEAWRPVVDFEGLYEVSDLGRARRVGRAARNGKGRGGGARIGLILAPLNNNGGHLCVQFWKNGKMTRRLIHRVVMAAFVGPCPPRIEVNHIDGVKTNNHLTNLEYVTGSENIAHAYRTGLRKPSPPPGGERHHNAKLTERAVAEIRRRYKPGVCTLTALAREFGVDHSTVRSVVIGETWKELA